MANSGGGAAPYRVYLSGVIAARVRQVQAQGTREGRGDAVLSAFREITSRLAWDPMNSGEPLYRLPGLRMQVRQIAIRPLYVDFAVCEDLPLVFLKGVTLLSRQGY